MEIQGILGCGFGPDYGEVMRVILVSVGLIVAVVVTGVTVAIRRERTRRRTESARRLVHAALLRAPETPGRDQNPAS